MATGTLEKKIAKLPAELKVEGHIDAIIEIKLHHDTYEFKLKKGFGGGKGLIEYMAEDFNEPLEEMKEYIL